MNEKTSRRKPFPIPVVPASPAADPALDACSAAESFALMVLGDSMAPEFVEGDIIIIEPEGLATDGAYVMAWLNDEWIFRQLVRDGAGWKLQPLNPMYPGASIPDLSVIKGVIIQKSKPGRRKATKRYID
jgi:DNA polymerase V